MRTILAAAAVTLIATNAFAADPMAPPAARQAEEAMPASMRTCDDMISQIHHTAAPADPARARAVRDELSAAGAANTEASCKPHAQHALDLLNGG